VPTQTVAAPALTPPRFTRSDLVILGGTGIAILIAGLTRYGDVSPVLAFVTSAGAVALLASLVGRSVDRLGDRLGAGATGVLQSALGNLPELFIAFFALRAGLVDVVQSALIGSILANLLLVLGAAFVVGGLRHGTLRFSTDRIRSTCALLALATAALVLPSIATYAHSKAEPHVRQLSVAVAVILLVVFALSLPASLRRSRGERRGVLPRQPSRGAASSQPGLLAQTEGTSGWPTWFSIGMLVIAGALSAVVSDWFVTALQPAMDMLGISQVFAGLVVVAIASNAIENVVGIQLAARNQAEYAISVIVNSPLQVALVLAPALVLLSLLTTTALTLVFAPMLVVSVVLTVLVVTIVVSDGESNWLEGAMLIGLYLMIAAVFWWG
jgi:Ca2+:H+ antiporter